MRKLLIATRNRHKTGEIAEMLGVEWEVKDMTCYPELSEPEETGSTFAENAIIKALAASVILPDLMLADDSGLEVDALGGEPGVYSARYAGAQATDDDNRRRLLAELRKQEALEGSSARFHCAMALAKEGKILQTFAGTVEGRVILTPAGEGGFGYDPLFVPDGFTQTMAELDTGAKNRISHRSRALAQVVQWLQR